MAGKVVHEWHALEFGKAESQMSDSHVTGDGRGDNALLQACTLGLQPPLAPVGETVVPVVAAVG
jgi:hypothetical protein